MRKDGMNLGKVMFVSFSVAGMAADAGAILQHVSSTLWVVILSLAFSAFIGAGTVALLRLVKLVGGVFVVIAVLPLADMTVGAMFRRPLSELSLGAHMIGVFVIVPVIAGVLLYCKLTKNWDVFEKPKQVPSESD